LAENRTPFGFGAGEDGDVPRTVLIVDDHAGFRRRARRALEADGYEVIGEAPNGAAGIEASEKLEPDVVLLDVHLPDASGFDIVSRMLAHSVVLISTHDRQDYGDLITRSGARGFLSKDQLCGANLEALVAEG
jgi:two-component system, NarL family, nitrate/nitrite response regulator NarL